MKKILDSLDEFLSSRKEQEQQLLFFLPVLLFGFLSYSFLYSITNKNLNNSIRKENNLTTEIEQIKKTNISLKSNNVHLKKILKSADVKLKELNKEKEDLNILVNQLGFLKFDLPKWAGFYNNIPKLAQKHHLYILSLDNEMFEENNKELVQKKMSIQIEVIGNFIDFMKFVNEFESKKQLIKIESIEITSDKMVVDIDIYGAKL